ncbi:MAG: DUF4190 domain-containing protein [Thermoleophilia bacterium]
MATAGWYGDPTSEGRLRYWDGAAWTEHISVDGGTAVEPITGIPPAPPSGLPAGAEAEAQAAAPAEAPVGATQVSPRVDAPAPGSFGAPAPAPADLGGFGPPAATGGVPYPPTMVARAGFVIAAIGGVLTAASAGSVAVEQETPFGINQISVAGGSWLGIVAAVLCVAAAAAPWAWARVVGVFASAFFAGFIALALIGFRSSEDLLAGFDVSLGTAGWLMFLGSLLLFVGTGIALARFRVPATGPDPSRSPGGGKSVVSLVLGIIGVLIPPVAAPAVGVGLFALDDITASGGRLSGRGFAKAGIILGVLSLVGWAVALVLMMILIQP